MSRICATSSETSSDLETLFSILRDISENHTENKNQYFSYCF